MKKISLSLPQFNTPHFTIPKAWTWFVLCMVAATLAGLAHDAWVFYQYGVGWQRDLDVLPITAQSFRESELDATLSTIAARATEYEHIRSEGVQMKNLFGSE